MQNVKQFDPTKPWRVVNAETRRVVRQSNNYRGANRHAEMLNQRYGAVRYGVEQNLPAAQEANRG